MPLLPHCWRAATAAARIEERLAHFGKVTNIDFGKFNLDKPWYEQYVNYIAGVATFLLRIRLPLCAYDRDEPLDGCDIIARCVELLLDRRPIHGVVVEATRHDIGNPVDWLRTNLVFARRESGLWGELSPLLRQLLV